MRQVTMTELPENPHAGTVYRLMPRTPNNVYYRERTDRNIGWITREEQEFLRGVVIGVAGCGGMGGMLASIFTRLGVGEVRIADSELFDASNINRQFGASRESVGVSKAFETARLVRGISDDTTLVVYPQGISHETVVPFLKGCAAVCDEIEAFVIDARIMLHQRARKRGIPIFNCNTVGFSTNLFLYTKRSMTIEESTGIDLARACELRKLVSAGDEDAFNEIFRGMMRAVVPVFPEYSQLEKKSDRTAFFERITQEKRIPIIATNPPMASGFLANRVLLYVLEAAGFRRRGVPIPPMPGYLRFDAADMTAQAVSGRWWRA